MPRIFQHIDKSSEETLGKVTRLKYIDDITEEDVFYYFEDGSCCNVEFIAPYDTQDPLNSHKAMIEVPSPNSLWQFKKREKIELDTDKKVARADDGNVYEAPPMLTLNKLLCATSTVDGDTMRIKSFYDVLQTVLVKDRDEG